MANDIVPKTETAQALAAMSWTDLASPLIKSLETDSETGMYRLGQMPAVTSSLKDRARAVIPRTEKHLTPALDLDVLAHVKRLLGFYYKDPKESASEIAAAAVVWVECLEEFPEWAIHAGIKEYLKNDSNGRKPKPGQIVALCRQQVSKYRMLLFRAKQILDAKEPELPAPPPTEEQKRQVAELVAQTVAALKAAPEPDWKKRNRERSEPK